MTSHNFRVKFTPPYSVTLGHKSRTPYQNYVTILPSPFKNSAAECCGQCSIAAGGIRTVLSRKPAAHQGCGRMMGQRDGWTQDHVIV